MSKYYELSRNICVDVLGVEFSGYGAASGRPSPDIVMQAADAAYEYAVTSGVPPSRILLYGQSIGSGPALGLAKRWPVAGAILHSPFLSGIQILDRSPECCCKPSCIFACCDFFHNDHAVRSVRCPVFIMHGQQDVFVPFYHAVRLKDRLPENCAWPSYFPEDASHNDLIEVDPEAYYAKLRAFVKSIKQGQAATMGKEIGLEMATFKGKLLAQRPAQVAMVSVQSVGIITRDHSHMQTQGPTQPGSGLTGCSNSPGLAAMSRATPPCSPESSPPQRSCTLAAGPDGAGVSKMALAVTEEMPPLPSLGSFLSMISFMSEVPTVISLKSEVGGDGSGASGTKLPRPLLLPQDF